MKFCVGLDLRFVKVEKKLQEGKIFKEEIDLGGFIGDLGEFLF